MMFNCSDCSGGSFFSIVVVWVDVGKNDKKIDIIRSITLPISSMYESKRSNQF